MLVPVAQILTPSTQKFLLRQLSQFELVIYQIFCKKLGRCKVPICVPLAYLVKCSGLTIRQVRYNIKKLVGKGLIERFVKYSSPFKKSPTYYRFPLLGSVKEEQAESQGRPL